ncbi:ThiF family adenylyltransferase [Streptomyces sp. ODS05-4]|uniref:ThiF family adenylyltransferase n=1 Tax=Streptomyces sp. ODS05-4 TaxID=2944939 RepID=UPI002109A742|nr:ThiF family adenylyltransferase [Streptomyces sp. ODS05-4]
MHPMVKPALRRAWRDLGHVQFGAAPAHAMVVGPVDTVTGALIGLLDGTRGLELLRAEARALGLPDGRLEALLDRLASVGLLDDAEAGGPRAWPPPAGSADSGGLGGSGDSAHAGGSRVALSSDRLAPDRASLSVVHREPGGAARCLEARRTTRVQVRGAGRVGAAIAALLSAAGVGRVEVLDGQRAEPWDVAPGGLPAEAVGERRDTAARRLVRRSASARPPRPARGGAVAGAVAGSEPAVALVVAAPRDGLAAYAPDPLPADAWVAAAVPHLYAGVVEATGVVGPLVLPGGTACARCVDLARTDRDPVWPRMLAQWRSGRAGAAPPCDVALAAAVSGLAAAHALAFLDGDLPASTGARWEASLPHTEWRGVRLAPHEDCPCGAAVHRASATGRAQDTMAG